MTLLQRFTFWSWRGTGQIGSNQVLERQVRKSVTAVTLDDRENYYRDITTRACDSGLRAGF